MTAVLPPCAADSDAVEVSFFGTIADSFGRQRRLAIPRSGISLAMLRRRLSSVGDERILDGSLRIAIDQVLVHGEATVLPGQEVAIMSPFSGG